MLRGSVLETQPALSRDDLKKGPKKSDVKKDGRNLYLIKEGGTVLYFAAIGLTVLSY